MLSSPDTPQNSLQSPGKHTKCIKTKEPEEKPFDSKVTITRYALATSHRLKVVNPGIFRANYVGCEMEVEGRDRTVERRESDFFFLRSALARLCPGCAVPPLPKAPLSSFLPAVLLRRQRK